MERLRRFYPTCLASRDWHTCAWCTSVVCLLCGLFFLTVHQLSNSDQSYLPVVCTIVHARVLNCSGQSEIFYSQCAYAIYYDNDFYPNIYWLVNNTYLAWENAEDELSLDCPINKTSTCWFDPNRIGQPDATILLLTPPANANLFSTWMPLMGIGGILLLLSIGWYLKNKLQKNHQHKRQNHLFHDEE